jgi:hypothetical protein
MNRSESELVPVGWREWVGLPGLRIKWIKAKVDTGALSSSLHALDVELFEKDGVEFVRFNVFPHQFDDDKVVAVETRVLEHRKIRSSNGQITDRPVIETNALIAGKIVRIELTLANRVDMGFRMLLGRKALRRNFVVDCCRSYLGNKRTKKSQRASKVVTLKADEKTGTPNPSGTSIQPDTLPVPDKADPSGEIK